VPSVTRIECGSSPCSFTASFVCANCSRQLGILKAAGIVDSRRDGTWVYYRITEQEHESVTNVLGVLAKTFGAEKALRVDHARLKKNCGPDACK
jgi:ArsR family transcriptional regulator